MSKTSPIIVGLDIGTTKIAVIAGIKNEFGKLEILAHGKVESKGVDHGMVLNLQKCMKDIENVLLKCQENNPRLDIKEVYVGIAGRHIKSLQTKGERVRSNEDDIINKQDVQNLVLDQKQTFIPAGDQIIDIVAQDFFVDGYANLKSPIGMTGRKIGANFHIITGEVSAIRNINRCVRDNNLEIKELALQPLASAAAVMSEEELEAGVAIIDIGGGTTDIAIFHEGMLRHTAVIPYAGNNVTLDIKNGLDVMQAQAELLKVQFGSALSHETKENEFVTIPGIRGGKGKEISTKSLSLIIESRMVEILKSVNFHLEKVGFDRNLSGGIIITGGGSQLKHIKQLTEYYTKYPARIGFPNEHLAKGYDKELEKPLYATCIGLVLRGIDDFENNRDSFLTATKNTQMVYDATPSTTALNEQADITFTATDTAIDTIKLDTEELDTPSAKVKGLNERSKSLKRIFETVRVKLLELFDDVDDRNLDEENFK
jgi:cell division protein FtsA